MFPGGPALYRRRETPVPFGPIRTCSQPPLQFVPGIDQLFPLAMQFGQQSGKLFTGRSQHLPGKTDHSVLACRNAVQFLWHENGPVHR